MTSTPLIIDDFDPILRFEDPTAWDTPDTWEGPYDPKSKEWLRGTWHKTDVQGAEVAFSFIGPSVSIYGHSGPAYGSYSVSIDDKVTFTKSAYAATNTTENPYELYSSANLTNEHHTIKLKNLGKQGSDAGGNGFLVDFVRLPVILGAEGSKVKNVTIEEDDKRLEYNGTWDFNKSGNFSGGGSGYTNEDGAEVKLKFNASTLYIFGDKKNDHGLYTVQLDNGPVETFNGISGCKGVFGAVCEQQLPSLKYFASNLNSSEHTVVVKNVRGNPEGKLGVNGTYFDLDSIVLTVPDKYPAPLNASTPGSGVSGGSPTGSSTGAQSSGGGGGGSASAGQNNNGAPGMNAGMSMLWAVMLVWLIRRTLRV